MAKEYLKDKLRVDFLHGNVKIKLWDARTGGRCCDKNLPLRQAYCFECGKRIEKRIVTLIEFGGDMIEIKYEPDTKKAMQKAMKLVEEVVGLDGLTKPDNPPPETDSTDNPDKTSETKKKKEDEDPLLLKIVELGWPGKAAQIFDEVRKPKRTTKGHG